MGSQVEPPAHLECPGPAAQHQLPFVSRGGETHHVGESPVLGPLLWLDTDTFLRWPFPRRLFPSCARVPTRVGLEEESLAASPVAGPCVRVPPRWVMAVHETMGEGVDSLEWELRLQQACTPARGPQDGWHLVSALWRPGLQSGKLWKM